MFSLRRNNASTTPASVPKGLISAFHFMIWASSAIVVGITGYFLKNFPHDQHLIFQMVIVSTPSILFRDSLLYCSHSNNVKAALTLFFWMPSFVAPFLKFYKFYYAIPNLVFSYLWLTAFIFAAQDYNEADCTANAPTGGSCNLKLTSESFIFLAL